MPEKNIILVGFMGAGKSTVAAELVKCGNYHLLDLDLDAEIERRSGLTIQEVFRQHEKTADLNFDTNNKNPQEIATEILYGLAEA